MNHSDNPFERRFRALIFVLVTTFAMYLGFSLWGGLEDVLFSFAAIGWLGALVTLLMSLANYGLRFIRWQIYLSAIGYPVDLVPSFRIYLSGFALTTTPGKAGEAFRGVLLKQRGVPYSSSFAAFVSERLSDLIAVVLLTIFGLIEYPQARSIVVLGVVLVVTVLISFSSSPLLDRIHSWASSRSSKAMSLLVKLVAMLREARRCHSPRLIIVATCLSVVAWGAESVAFYWVLQWLGSDISLTFAVFVYALSMLAGGLSFLPGGLGGTEAVMVSLLVLKGMSLPAAVAATVFIRLATLWFAVLIGIIALIKSRHGEQLKGSV